MSQAKTLPPFIAQEQLVKMAGQESYDQGLTLVESLKVSDLTSTELKASGNIEGHDVVLNYHDQQVQGACTCPASDGFDFCVHCVCLCLHMNKQIQQIRSLSKGPDKSKVLAYLLSLDKQALAKQFLNLITEDANEFERYLLKAFLHQNEIDYSQLKAHITQLTRKPENLFSQRQVKVFFSKLERFLAELNADDAPDFEADKFQKVIEYAFQRINILLEHIDDSTEQRSACVLHLHELYAEILSKNLSRDDTQAKRFFSFWIEDRYDLLGINSVKWLSQKAQEKFKTIALEHWKKHKNSEKESLLKSWQIIKLARYLFEEAIQSHDNLLAYEYRPFFSKE